MKRLIGMFLFIWMISTQCYAHFGMIIPSDTMVMPNEKRTIELNLSFSHPFEMIGMAFERPKSFGVVLNKKSQDLLPLLTPFKILGHKAFQATYPIKRPGAYLFYMEPTPYFEPSEDCYIIHYTKTVVTAFGSDEGWDQEIGLKTEIVPLSKPFGLYTHNVFQGIVKVNGKSVPFASVEVEYFNETKKNHAPTPYMITQTVKADQNGVFTYAAPKEGWWGFSALTLADEKLIFKGEKKDVELGAVIWVRFHDFS